MKKKVHISSLKDIERFDATIENGLSTEQVQRRTEQGLFNKSRKKYSKSYGQILLSNVFTFFNMLLFIVAAAQFAVKYYEGSFFLIILFSNMIIGLYQDVRAKWTIDKLRLVTAPTAVVMRNSLTEEIRADAIVLDDIIHLSSGKQIPSDAIVIDGKIEVNESMLTGESLAVKKNIGDEIFAGSYVVSGKASVRVERVGLMNYIEQLQEKAKAFKRPKSELLRSMHFILKVISYFIVPLGIGLAFANYRQSPENNIPEVVKFTAGALIGMIPSGMFLLTSMTLAVGVRRLGKHNALVQELYCIEMLARVNIICFDKTGTLTDGTMNVKETKIMPEFENIDINEIMGSFLTATGDENQTALALQATYSLNKSFKAKTVVPFSSERKYSAVTFEEKGTYVLGAPEFIYMTTDKTINSYVQENAQRGLRVLLLVYSKEEIKGEKIPKKVEPVALFVIQDHVREEAFDTIAWFKQNDVKVRIISGDNPITVAEIARQCGVDNSDNAINLEGMSLDEVKGIVNEYTVFGRVSPEQKACIIQTLRESGNTVAMTGDGVNDILALKQADCSVAMASGSEATRNISHLVLMDSNFASMPRVVEEGRRVINNLQNTCSLFLVKTTFTVLFAILFLIVGLLSKENASNQYPFVSANLYIWEIGAIGVASFFLALQPNKKRLKGGFIDNVVSIAFPAGITMVIAVGFIFLLRLFPELTGVVSEEIDTTMAVLVMSFLGFVFLYRLCMPFNKFRRYMYGIILTATIIVSCVVMIAHIRWGFSWNLLAIYPTTLTLKTILITVGVSLISVPFYFWLEKIFAKYIFNRRKLKEMQANDNII